MYPYHQILLVIKNYKNLHQGKAGQRGCHLVSSDSSSVKFHFFLWWLIFIRFLTDLLSLDFSLLVGVLDPKLKHLADVSFVLVVDRYNSFLCSVSPFKLLIPSGCKGHTTVTNSSSS